MLLFSRQHYRQQCVRVCLLLRVLYVHYRHTHAHQQHWPSPWPQTAPGVVRLLLS
jgi:hypothetical protein